MKNPIYKYLKKLPTCEIQAKRSFIEFLEAGESSKLTIEMIAQHSVLVRILNERQADTNRAYGYGKMVSEIFCQKS